MEQINLLQSIPKRHGRQNASRQDAISMTLKQEKEEFEGIGIEFPNVVSNEGFMALKAWSGNVKDMPNLQLRKFKKIDLVKAAEAEEQRGEELGLE